MPPRIPIGYDDFRTLREAGLEYVDKSDMIRELILRSAGQVTLFPRPRRFGKTLNLSMLRCWFEKTGEDLSHLFRDLAIWQAGDDVRAHFQRYPVMWLSLKDLKLERFERTMEAIQLKVRALYNEHAYLLESDRLDERQRADVRAILDGTASRGLLDRSLLDLSACLHAHHGERVILLIDEYDEPIHAGYLQGYTKEILDFMRAFFGYALKGNPHLQRAVMTGILRVAKENLFSGLNNPAVYSLLARPFGATFGFTEPEVAALLGRFGLSDKMEEVRAWYNGYLFGGEIVYNPWSLCNYISRADEGPQSYWLSTSSNDLVKELLERYAVSLQPVFEVLLEGGSIERRLHENVALNELMQSEDALWGLLVFAGYLRAEDAPRDALDRRMHRLSIPNREVREVYADTFAAWLRRRVEARGGGVLELTEALLTGDAEVFQEQLQAFVTDVLSYHDVGKLRPERVYHAFLVGLLAVLEPGHQVRSNRESGSGRPDVLIRPRNAGEPGVVLELKVARPSKKTLEQALEEGLAQLEGMDYGAELRAAGASPVHAFAVAFDGKEVRVASFEPAKKRPARARKTGRALPRRAKSRAGAAPAKATARPAGRRR
jgi:Predicted AAA-ATPase/PD-(D/E)XK nuclease superfamily